MKLKQYIYIVTLILCGVLSSCQGDLDELMDMAPGQEDTVLIFKMDLDVLKTDFDDDERKEHQGRGTGHDWQNGDVLFLKFRQNEHFVNGRAVYLVKEHQWQVEVYGKLTPGMKGLVEVFHIKGDLKASGSSLYTLTEEIAAYQDLNGTYSFVSDNVLLVNAHLKPFTSRVRFKGTANDLIEVEGLKCLTSFDANKGEFVTAPRIVTARVGTSTYTPYIYGVLSDSVNSQITINHNIKGDTYQFTAKCKPQMFQVGKSGWLQIPILPAPKGWTAKKLDHGWLDMGLSVKWASCNIGATSPTDYGEHFQRGESRSQNMDGKMAAAVSVSDIASDAWGKSWRMPSRDEFLELIDNSVIVDTVYNSVPGYWVKSKLTGQGIFLIGDEKTCVYWSSTLDEKNSGLAYLFRKTYLGPEVMLSQFGDGALVRPVRSDLKQRTVEVTTGQVEKVSSHSASVKAFFRNIIQQAVYGIEYVYYLGLQQIKQEQKIDVSHDGEYSVDLNNLRENTNYTYRAFAKSEGMAVYGSYEEFFTGKGEVLPDPGMQTLPYKEDFASSLGLFQNFTTSGVGEWKIAYSTAKASGYSRDTIQDGTFYLVSPAISLVGKKDVHVMYEYIYRFETKPENQELLISSSFDFKDPTKGWNLLNNDHLVCNDWHDFRRSDVQIPTEYMGKNIRLAFRYNCDNKEGSTWEIRNFLMDEGLVGDEGDNSVIGDTTTTNGNFETWVNGRPHNWVSSGIGNAVVSRSKDAHSGMYSVKVQGRVEQNQRLAYKELTLDVGTYTMRFYAMAATPEGGIVRPGYVPIIPEITGDHYTYDSYHHVEYGKWTECVYTFKIPDLATYSLLVMNAKQMGKDVLIDDFSLVDDLGNIIIN